MPKKATKAANNVFYQARISAASYNDNLSSREGASEATGIDRNRIVRTELGAINPYPDEVVVYADLYNAPELMNYYCSTLCPIGKETVDSLEITTLERACLKLLSSSHQFSEAQEQLVQISQDGEITEEEQDQMQEIMDKLRRVANDISALDLLCKKLLKGTTEK